MPAAAARPQVNVYDDNGKSVAMESLPEVFLAPIRTDIVHFVHTNMAKNKRQAYGTAYMAGHNYSAVSWGPGRAVARVPRISGSGTGRAGQGAFGNQCRGGRMFNPHKTFRKWQRKLNKNQKRYAVVSAVAASALPALVMARGHKVEQVPEFPLVVANDVESYNKTKQAVKLLSALGAHEDVEKARESKTLRAGQGKLRGRRYIQRKGPLVVYKEDNGIVKAFRNLPGVELCRVDALNLLQLAPGAHVGRFVVWTQGAFNDLTNQYGGFRQQSTVRAGYTLPQNLLSNSDITSVVNSDAVQSVLRPAHKQVRRYKLKYNPLKNKRQLARINPYAAQQ